MTSIAHPVLPGAVPAVGGSSAPATTSSSLFRPAGSKAVRVGLGVAIAAVMAGDVYAVLRSPVSEGRGAGAPAAAMLDEATGGATGFASTAGHVATNPFSDAAYGATLGFGGSGVASRSATTSPFTAAPASASTVLPAAPAAGPASATIVLPKLPAAPTSGTPSGPGSNYQPPQEPATPQDPAAEPSLLAPVVEQVLPVVEQLPAPVSGPVAQAVTEVADQLPASTVDPVVDALPAPVTSTLPLR